MYDLDANNAKCILRRKVFDHVWANRDPYGPRHVAHGRQGLDFFDPCTGQPTQPTQPNIAACCQGLDLFDGCTAQPTIPACSF